MKTKKGKKFIIGIVFFIFFAGISLFIAFSPVFDKKIGYEDTVEHSATINDLVLKDALYEIIIAEYPCAITVNKSEIIDDNSIQKLRSGEIIIFRIPKFYDELLDDNNIQSVPIVSLKTEDTIIVSLESQNKIEDQAFFKVRITAIVFSIIFVCGAATCLGFLIKLKNANANVVN